MKLTEMIAFYDNPWTYTHDDYPGLRVEIGHDPDCESPRYEHDLGTMAVSYRRYRLGDVELDDIGFEPTREVMVEGPVTKDAEKWLEENVWYDFPDDPVSYIKRELGARIVLPLIVYEHSGITMRVGSVGDITGDSEGWDTSFVGFIYDTPDKLKDCGDLTDAEIAKSLRAEVEVYAQYLEGDCYYFIVEDELSNSYESCHGFIGHESVEHEAESYLNWAIERHEKEKSEREFWKNREVVTV